jgi:hypothetical protein
MIGTLPKRLVAVYGLFSVDNGILSFFTLYDKSVIGR